MKKITLSLMLIFAMLIVPVAIFAAEGDVAKIGDTGYSTLADAVKAVPTDKTETTIELLKNVENGPGIVTENGQNVIIDFNGYSYDASEPTVGSNGTKTLGAQLNKGSKVIFKDGTFTTVKGKRVIQNYADLTLDNMIIDGTKGPIVGYVASFNNGKVEVKGNTSILAKEGDCAFDICWWPKGYSDGTQVVINTTGKIDGNIEIGDFQEVTDAQKANVKSTLEIKNVTLDGKIIVAKDYFLSKLGVNYKVLGGTYSDLGSVVNLIPKNTETTIKLLRNVENGSGIVTVNGQNVVIDFNGYSYDASEPTVGSDGTKTLACQLNKGSKVTFKNGIFTTVKGKRVIQNYANLTLDNMVIDGTKGLIVGYVASFNNGKAEIKGNTSILAKKGDCAFDICWWPKGYPDGTQVVINTTGKIDGDIEIGDYLEVTEAQKADVKATLEIKNAYLDGEIKIAKDYFNAYLKDGFKVTGGSYTTDVTKVVPEGYRVIKDGDWYTVCAIKETEAEVSDKVADTEKVEEMVLETLKEAVAEDSELAEAIEGKSIEVEVEFKPVEINKSEKETIEKEAAKKVEDIKVAEYIDIAIVVKDADTDEELAKLSTVKEAIKFTVEVPSELKADIPEGYTRIFYIIRNHNGVIDVLETKEADGKLTFESDKFSTYAIAYKDVKEEPTTPPADEGEEGDSIVTPPTGEGEAEKEPEAKPTTPDVPKTGDNVVVYAVLAVVAMAGIVVGIKMRKK